MYVPTLGHAWRITRVIARRIVYNKKKKINQTIATRAVPYMVEFINDHRITPEHLAAIVNMFVETEILGICVRAITIALSMHKYIGK